MESTEPTSGSSATSSSFSSDLEGWQGVPEQRISHFSRQSKMPVEHFASQGSHMYGQADLDQAFKTESIGSIRHHLDGHLPTPANYDHVDIVDGQPQHSGFDSIYPNGTDHFNSTRYRTNASSSSSLGNSYGEQIYSQHSFSDSVPSFGNGNGHSYDMINNVHSSYSSGKVSPVTPVDGNTPLPPIPYSNGLLEPKQEFQNYDGLLSDHRISSQNYPSDFQDDYVMGNVSQGLHYGQNGIQHIPDRYERFQDSRFSQTRAPNQHHSDVSRSVAPLATQPVYRQIDHYDDMPPYSMSRSQGDLPMGVNIDETLKVMRIQSQSLVGSSSDLQVFMRPYVDQYVHTPNRLALGERTVIVMSSKVAQKSYGTEKRFLCPPPTAILIGNSWWSDLVRRGEEPKLCPPRVVVSISGEATPSEGALEWQDSLGNAFDGTEPPTGTTYIGRCVGKQLYISDVDEKKKRVEALVKVTAPALEGEDERIIGVFPSRPIKVISKPSKKRQSAKNLELCINHGSTISLFHRLRSQTVSTKYLCVSGSGSSFKGSDGAPLMGLDQRSRTATPSFIARTAAWDPFVIYIVDVNKQSNAHESIAPPPPQPDYPSPPPNAISFANNGSHIPIYYNQTIVLQCLTSGVVSPVLIIRKVDHQTTVVGGGLQDGAKGVADHFCAPAEVCGDPVSQLHKVAFEVYDPTKPLPEYGQPGLSGAFLSCMGEKVNTYRPIDPRSWNMRQPIPDSDSPAFPGSPITPVSGLSDYFSQQQLVGSAPASPSASSEFLSNDGGRVRKPKRSSSSTGGIVKSIGPKARARRPASAGSATSSRRTSSSDHYATSGALWQVDIGETSVWTIVGTDQVRYNFYVPPVLFEGGQPTPPAGGSFPVPTKPLTPFPSVIKCLPPDRPSDLSKMNHHSRHIQKPPKPANKLITVYGEHFNKHDPPNVYFGTEPSPYVEVRCPEVLGCLPPDASQLNQKRRPVLLVRSDGVIFPSAISLP